MFERYFLFCSSQKKITKPNSWLWCPTWCEMLWCHAYSTLKLLLSLKLCKWKRTDMDEMCASSLQWFVRPRKCVYVYVCMCVCACECVCVSILWFGSKFEHVTASYFHPPPHLWWVRLGRGGVCAGTVGVCWWRSGRSLRQSWNPISLGPQTQTDNT